MNVIRETRFRGVLPAGLVLNAKIPTRSSGGALGFVKPIVKDYGGPLPTGDTAVMLKGTFLDPVLLADLRIDTSGPFSEDPTASGSFKLDPYHDAVMLMTSVEFSGFLIEVTGAWSTAKLPEMYKRTIETYGNYHPTSGEEVLTKQKVYVAALACDVYIPKRSRFFSTFAATQSTFEYVTPGIIGLNAALPDATSLPTPADPVYKYVIKGYEFTLPPVAQLGFVQIVPAATPTYVYREGAVPASFRPTSAEGVAFAKSRFALTVCPRSSAAIASGIKDNFTPELAADEGQAAPTLMKYWAIGVQPPTFVSFSQLNDVGVSFSEDEF